MGAQGVLTIPKTKPPSGKARFTTFTLPPKYDNLSEVTKLWLQSRIDTAPKKKGKKGKDDNAVDEKKLGEKDLTRLPAEDTDDTLEHASAGPVFRSPGTPRPVTLASIWIWLDLARLLSPHLRTAAKHMHVVRVAIHVLKLVLDKLQPTARLYATSQLYDLVESAIGGRPATWRHALTVASAGLFISTFDEVVDGFFSTNDHRLHTWLDFMFERAYLSMQLDAPLTTTDPFLHELVYEAGVFSGMEYAPFYSDGPWGMINGLGGALATGVDIAAQLAMLVQAIGGVEQLKRRDPKALLLLLLAFGPVTASRLQNYLHYQDDEEEEEDPLLVAATDEEYIMKSLATEHQHKQEVALFGLRDWVLSRWTKAKETVIEREEKTTTRNRTRAIGFQLLNGVLSKAFYVLLATKTIDTGLSLGSIHTYQNTASSLIWSFRSLSRNFHQSFQSLFYASAFVGALEPRQSGLDIDYETTRVSGGMRIEAKNLSFQYPGAEKPTLSGINLTIEPGETLAIVGYNGGGKTTLVKVLMGLHEHMGELLVNGTPIEHLDSATMHKRTSALFQDFERHELTLRDNVGIGLVSKIGDTAAVTAAIEAGGAQGVLEECGLEGGLNPYGEPRTFTTGIRTWRDDYSDSEDETEYQSDSDDEEVANERANGISEKASHDAEDAEDAPLLSPSPTGATTPAEVKEKRRRKKVNALSGGQWQRVGLARAFMRAGEADLVVFDEPSAALDPRAEAALFANIHGLARAAGATTIYISHRFNTVRKADRIALVADGTIAEYGTHAELMALNGQYRELFTMQAEGYLDGEATPAPAGSPQPEQKEDDGSEKKVTQEDVEVKVELAG